MNLPFLVGLAGNIKAGKSYLAEHLAKDLAAASVQFADPMYKMLNVLDPGIYQGMAQEEKLKPFVANPDWTRRQALQYFGTEIMREQVKDSVWIDCFAREVEHCQAIGLSVICADVRFPNEIKMIHELGGIVVWVSRPEHEIITGHISGTAITKDSCDCVVDNSGDIKTAMEGVLSAWIAHIRSSN